MKRFKKIVLFILFLGLILLYSRNFKYQAKMAKHHELEYHDSQNFQTEVVMNFIDPKFFKEEKHEIKADNKKISENLITKARQDVQILCIIMTSESTFSKRIPTMWEYWVKKCDKAVFACNCKNVTKTLKLEKNNATVQNLVDNIMQLEVVEHYDQLDVKSLEIVKTTYQKYGNLFNWFILVDDDTFVFVENLKIFASRLNPNESVTYGYNLREQVDYHSGGGGVLFTKTSLKKIHDKIVAGECKRNPKNKYGDIAIGECGFKAGVKLGNSLDEFGRERFHALNFFSHYTGYFPEWIFQFAINAVQMGRECCSDESITFHYNLKKELRRFVNMTNPRNISELFQYYRLT